MVRHAGRIPEQKPNVRMPWRGLIFPRNSAERAAFYVYRPSAEIIPSY